MLKHLTTKIQFILFLILSNTANAQQWIGRTTGNYSGTYGIYNNASSISDSKYKYYFNFWGRGDNFYNNYLLYNAPIKLNKWASGNYDPMYQNSDGKADVQDDWFIEKLNGSDKYLSFNQDIWGPAFMFQISRNLSMSINTRQRNSLQFFGISEPFARMLYKGIDSAGGVYDGSSGLSRNEFYSNGRFGANMQSNQELSVTMAGILARNDNHQLSGGLTVKYIRGLGASSMKGKGFDYAVTGDNSIQVQNANIQYAYTDAESVVEPFAKPYGLFSLKSNGYGAGVDLGLTYTYTARKNKYAGNQFCNDDSKRSDYDVKIAMAFNDIGGIRYNQNAVKYSYSEIHTANVNVPANTFKNLGYQTSNGFDTIGKYVFEQLGAYETNRFNTSLPAAFNLQTDFRITKYLYTSVFLNQSLKGIRSTGMKSTSMLSIVPRYESRNLEVSMPLTLSENYKNFYMGAYVRFGPVFFGTDNIGGLLKVASNNQFRGADIYGGVSFGIDHCKRWWYDDLVEPNHIDTVQQRDTIRQKDTLKTEEKDIIEKIQYDTVERIIRDTVKLIIHDTVAVYKKGQPVKKIKVHDTVYVEKIVRSKVDIQKENDLKNREILLINRQKELEQREKVISEKEKGIYNESETTKDCRNQNAVLLAENTKLKTKINNQDAEIIKSKSALDKAENDARTAARKADSLQAVVNMIFIDLNNCRKNAGTTTDAEIIKANNAKTKAENDAKIAVRKADSLQSIVKTIYIDLANCRKNAGTATDAEIIKANSAKTKAENDAKVIARKADSLQKQLEIIYVELNNCKKSNGTTTDAVVIKAKSDKDKAENDAKIAIKKADSLQAKLDIIHLEVDNCKKNNTQTDAIILKLKKAETDKDLYKTELDAANKIILTLNAKIYRKDATIDSLLSELSKCGGNLNNDELTLLIKKCNESKAERDAEILTLKNRLNASDKTLDSMKIIASNLEKERAERDAEIILLNKKINDNNCDELTKEIQEKTKTINDLKTQNNALQLKVNSLNIENSNLKTELIFVTGMNQKCNKKLDSCMRGLLEHKNQEQSPPTENNDQNKGGDGSGEGNQDKNIEGGSVPSGKNEDTGLGLQIIKAILNSGNTMPNTSGNSLPGRSGNGTTVKTNSESSSGGSSSSGSRSSTPSTNPNPSTRRR